MDKMDIVLEGLQAVNRHYLLTKIDDNDLKEALEEQKEIINLLWETYQEN